LHTYTRTYIDAQAGDSKVNVPTLPASVATAALGKEIKGSVHGPDAQGLQVRGILKLEYSSRIERISNEPVVEM